MSTKKIRMSFVFIVSILKYISFYYLNVVFQIKQWHNYGIQGPWQTLFLGRLPLKTVTNYVQKFVINIKLCLWPFGLGFAYPAPTVE